MKIRKYRSGRNPKTISENTMANTLPKKCYEAPCPKISVFILD